jgi:hypothetical protein
MFSSVSKYTPVYNNAGVVNSEVVGLGPGPNPSKHFTHIC